MGKKYKYKTSIAFREIEKVEIEKETEKTVWYINNGGSVIQSRKQSDYENFFDTYSDAKSFLIKEIDKKIKSLKYNLELRKKEKEEILRLYENDKFK